MKKKERKKELDQEKQKKQDLDQEKNQVLRSYFFFFINSHLCPFLPTRKAREGDRRCVSNLIHNLNIKKKYYLQCVNSFDFQMRCLASLTFSRFLTSSFLRLSQLEPGSHLHGDSDLVTTFREHAN